ncbi:MAG: nucleotidyltransferase domain-containing protein [Thermodesulfobacteriota bacterium]|nr:nucleotidyltransferase domain-containing protein [Thermodesulfobacteriota bacterium]
MLTKEIIAEILREEYPHIISEYGLKRIGLFGSYAKGLQEEDSDIDIIAEFEKTDRP